MYDVDKIIERGYAIKNEEDFVSSLNTGKVTLQYNIEGNMKDNTEGIWVGFLDEQSMNRYQNDESMDEELDVIILNMSLMTTPYGSFGMYAKAVTNGDKRPVVLVDEEFVDRARMNHEYHLSIDEGELLTEEKMSQTYEEVHNEVVKKLLERDDGNE